MKYSTWINDYLQKDKLCGLRVGQSYLGRVRQKWNNPDLFYEVDEDRAWEMIHQAEKDWQGE